MKTFLKKDLSGDARRLSAGAVAICAIALVFASLAIDSGSPDSPPDEERPPKITREQSKAQPPIEKKPERKEVPEPPTKAGEFLVSGWLPYWATDEGMDVIMAVPQAFDQVSPFWYESRDDGRVVSYPKPERPEVIARLRDLDLKIIPTIRSFDATVTSSVITDDAKSREHIARIVKLVVTKGYDGIDIDYESIHPDDRKSFSSFIAKLGEALRANNKILVTTVYAKTAFPGSPGSSYGHDYRPIGAGSDYVRIMGYDQHYPGGPPGPIASLEWIESVLTYAVEKIPRDKVILGVPAFGYDWPADGGRASSILLDDAVQLAASYDSTIHRNFQARSPYFSYESEAGAHVVWFEDYESLQAKIELAQKLGIAGISIWRLGPQNPEILSLLDDL